MDETSFKKNWIIRSFMWYFDWRKTDRGSYSALSLLMKEFWPKNYSLCTATPLLRWSNSKWLFLVSRNRNPIPWSPFGNCWEHPAGHDGATEGIFSWRLSLIWAATSPKKSMLNGLHLILLLRCSYLIGTYQSITL